MESALFLLSFNYKFVILVTLAGELWELTDSGQRGISRLQAATAESESV